MLGRSKKFEKWKKAVVHLECVRDEPHFLDMIKQQEVTWAKIDKGIITEEEYKNETLKNFDGLSKDRVWGTAIFLCHDSKRYLITAKHVLFDELSSNRIFQEEKEYLETYPDESREYLLEYKKKQTQNTIFKKIYRVPSLNEILSNNKKIPQFLMNLESGVPDEHPYTFSLNHDLAIISLDRKIHSSFADELIKQGYEPISLKDIKNEPTKEGTKIFTVGFPGSLSKLGKIDKDISEKKWSSEFFSLPAFTFGKVSMLYDELPFFWADMSVYPGNSGGPVVENSKLVGIVSIQPTVEETGNVIETSVKKRKTIVNVGIPFGNIIKAKYLFDLIKQQEQKDNLHSVANSIKLTSFI